ncbi:site-2 protease family protein [Actinomyces ruminicola]|uniref:Zn-dependent protease (Includes SpoIVFB) n=1 Tax=Actinomyces ruminicola TaxID=332524 RepID=A0A1G9UD28_9ACTO|nr:site-2 protease family protein [Actinomyces ruminicola]SDM57743.1 Zn-dependent protease (includes SpoIVFB) [Actinomyces ruminicola]
MTASVARRRSDSWTLFTLGGAPVVVAPTSLLLGLLIAGSWYPVVSSALAGHGAITVLGTVAATVLGVGVSVLMHELAHGAAGTLLGRRPVRYELYLWGGRTSFGPSSRWRPWKDVITSLAGPAANLTLWAVGHGLLDRIESAPVFVAAWALTWVNLALAVFNALPGLPLDGGHALAALVEQLTGRRVLGQRLAAVGGLIVVGGVAWSWILAPLLAGRQPDTFSLFLAVMIAGPIATTSWRVLGLGRGTRAAARLDLRTLTRPVAVVPADTPLTAAREQLDAGAGLVLVAEGSRILGTLDAPALAELERSGLPDAAAVAVSQVCTVLPAAAVTTQATGQPAADALARARTVSRWLVLVEGGRVAGAVPTGAR